MPGILPGRLRWPGLFSQAPPTSPIIWPVPKKSTSLYGTLFPGPRSTTRPGSARRTGLATVTSAEILPQAAGIRQAYIEDYRQSKREPFKEALEQNDQDLISFFRLIGQRTGKEPKKH